MSRKRTSASSELVQFDSPGQPRRFPGQLKRSLRVAIAIRYNYYVQLVAIRRDWMRESNLKFRSAR